MYFYIGLIAKNQARKKYVGNHCSVEFSLCLGIPYKTRLHPDSYCRKTLISSSCRPQWHRELYAEGAVGEGVRYDLQGKAIYRFLKKRELSVVPADLIDFLVNVHFSEVLNSKTLKTLAT